MSKKNCYGGTQFEASGIVVDLQNNGSEVKFRLEPVLAKEAAMTDGKVVAKATVLICHKLIRTCNGMLLDPEVFFANREWKYVYRGNSSIKNGDMVRIFIERDEIDRVRASQMDESVEIQLASVIKS